MRDTSPLMRNELTEMGSQERVGSRKGVLDTLPYRIVEVTSEDPEHAAAELEGDRYELTFSPRKEKQILFVRVYEYDHLTKSSLGACSSVL